MHKFKITNHCAHLRPEFTMFMRRSLLAPFFETAYQRTSAISPQASTLFLKEGHWVPNMVIKWKECM